MPDDSELIEDDDIFGESETTDAVAEAQSAPDDLSSDDGSVDLGSQTQPSDAEPTQNEYAEPQAAQAPQVDPQWIGAAHALGIQNPEQMPPERLAYAIQSRNREIQQQVQFARHAQSDWSNYEAWKREQAAGVQGRAPAAAAPEPAKPEPVDFRKALADAIEGPTPPSYAKALVDGGHIKQTAGGRYVVAPGSEQVVGPEELAEINKYVADLKTHREKSFEAVESAIEQRLEARLAEREQHAAKAQYVQQFANQVGRHAQDAHGNPTPYGQALMRNLLPLKESGLSHDAKLQIAHNAAMGQLAQARAAEQYRQQQYTAWYHQTYGAPPQTQSFNQPIEQYAPQAQAPAPQPHTPNFLDVASHSANGSPFGNAGEDEWQPKHFGDLKERTFGQAARQLARR